MCGKRREVKRRGILDIFGRMMYSNIYILSKSEI
jgi:hypothetical protein